MKSSRKRLQVFRYTYCNYENIHSFYFYYFHWCQTKVETTGATQDYKTLISRLFETFLDFGTKKSSAKARWRHCLEERPCKSCYNKFENQHFSPVSNPKYTEKVNFILSFEKRIHPFPSSMIMVISDSDSGIHL